MLQEILQKLQDEQGRALETLNSEIARLNDDVATKTEWTHLPVVATNFETVKLVDVPGYGLKFKPAFLETLFNLLFLVPGLYTAYSFAAKPLADGEPWNKNITVGLVVGCVFTGLGLWMYASARRDRGFSLGTGAFVMGGGGAVPFDTIHALQLICYRSTGNKRSSFKNYQINLVLNDATRVHVANYASVLNARAHLGQIAGYISKPAWDMGDHLVSPLFAPLNRNKGTLSDTGVNR
jgi:hypothetical protein